jgi:hypothetical protein
MGGSGGGRRPATAARGGGGGARRRWPGCAPVRQNSPDKDQKKEEGAVNSLRSLERRERRRRSRSAPATCGGGAVRRGRRRGEGCGVMRERCPAFIGRRRGRGCGVEAVARAQRPAAIDDEGARWSGHFGRGDGGAARGSARRIEYRARWREERAREAGEAPGTGGAARPWRRKGAAEGRW